MPLASIQQLHQLLRDPSQTFEFEDDDWVVLLGGQATGLIVGESPECEPTNGEDLVSMLTGFVQDPDIPVLYGPRFGHTADKLSIPIGGYARLNTKRKNILFSGTDNWTDEAEEATQVQVLDC